MAKQGTDNSFLQPNAPENAPGINTAQIPIDSSSRSPEVITLRAPSPQRQHRVGPRSPQIPKAAPSRRASATAEAEAYASPPCGKQNENTDSVSAHGLKGPLPRDFLRCWSSDESESESEQEPELQQEVTDRALLEVFVADGEMARPHGIVMSLSIRLVVGGLERLTTVQGGMYPRWFEKTAFMIKKPYPPTMDIYLDDIGLFRESTIARARIHLAPIYESGPKRCVVTLVNQQGNREAVVTLRVALRPIEARGAAASGDHMPQRPVYSEAHTRSPPRITSPADQRPTYPNRGPSPAPNRALELRDEVAIEQISNMFPGYDRDMVFEMFVAFDGDSTRIVDTLLAMAKGNGE